MAIARLQAKLMFHEMGHPLPKILDPPLNIILLLTNIVIKILSSIMVGVAFGEGS